MKLIINAALLFVTTFLFGQTQNLELLEEILKNDSLIFEEVFNKCNFNDISTLINDDFEFYHDQHGITYGKENFIKSIKENICSLPYRPRRELVKGSSFVYALMTGREMYGAIQTGRHRFFANEDGKEEYFTSIADFSHLWIIDAGKLKLKRVLSYNHKSTDSVDEPSIEWNSENIEKWLKDNKVPCLGLGIINYGELTDVRVYGELKSGIKAPYNTIFNVASLTKPIVSMTVLKLVDLGKWDIDEPLYKYWIDPDVKNDPTHKLLTSRHVLNHETGFMNWRTWHDTKKLTFDFAPGNGFNYSGEGFEYLRKALENKFGVSIEEIVNETIFQPLGMKDSKFTWNKYIEEERFAHWHNVDGENTYQDYKILEANAADNLLTTIEDYGKFAKWIVNGAGFSKSLFDEMISTHEVNGQQTGMGLGWEVYPNLGNEYALVHSGADRGVHCVSILFPISKQGLVIMTNSDNGHKLYQKCVVDNLKLGKQLMERGK